MLKLLFCLGGALIEQKNSICDNFFYMKIEGFNYDDVSKFCNAISPWLFITRGAFFWLQAYDRKKLMLFVTPSFGFHLNVFFPTIVPL